MLPLLRSAVRLRVNFTLHDALYVVLPQALNGQLLTADSKFTKAPIDSALFETWD